jgi:hypothetical protein
LFSNFFPFFCVCMFFFCLQVQACTVCDKFGTESESRAVTSPTALANYIANGKNSANELWPLANLLVFCYRHWNPNLNPVCVDGQTDAGRREDFRHTPLVTNLERSPNPELWLLQLHCNGKNRADELCLWQICFLFASAIETLTSILFAETGRLMQEGERAYRHALLVTNLEQSPHQSCCDFSNCSAKLHCKW